VNPDRPRAPADPRAASTWRPVAGIAGAWHAELQGAGGARLRAVALRLTGGGLAVLSPLRGGGPAAHEALRGLGQVELLVAPNHFHNLGLREHLAAHPGAKVVATGRAAPRLRRRCGVDVEDPALLRGRLPPGFALLVPPGTRNGELWISADAAAGRAWIVADAFFNLSRLPATPLGLLLRLLGVGPGLRIGTTWRWMLHDAAAYKAWLLARLADERPAMLVPSHGDVIRDPALADRLRLLAERRL
jgi:hypothetical protein